MTDLTLLSRVRAALDILHDTRPNDEEPDGEEMNFDVYEAVAALEGARVRLENAEEAEADSVATPIEPVDDEPLSPGGLGMDDAEVERIARCCDPECRPNSVCDDYICGRIVEDPEYFVECIRQGCSASTPNVMSREIAEAAWSAMIRAIAEALEREAGR